jgi:hypothetical protein
MDFVERLLGISPDAGSGTTELILISLPLLVATLIIARRYGRGTQHIVLTKSSWDK